MTWSGGVRIEITRPRDEGTDRQEHGVKNESIGIRHPGLLDVLVNFIRKPTEAIPPFSLNEFSGTADLDDSLASDVKYYSGACYSYGQHLPV